MTESALRPRPRAAIERMAPYSPPTGGRRGRLRLDFNENTIGCSPKVVERLWQACSAELLSIYPEYEDARRRLGEFHGVDSDQVLISNGTDEAIHLLTQTYADPGDEALMPWPTFPMFRFYAQAADVEAKRIDYRRPGLDFPTEELIEAVTPRSKLVFVANPNNPTGRAVGLDVVERLLRAAPAAALLIDEAYFEFYGVTALELIPRYPNLFVSRTFSKAYGLAGLRVGCLLSQAENIAAIRRGQSPYSVGALSIICALAAIDDPLHVEAYVAEVKAAREELYAALNRLGVAYWPSSANFVLTDLGERGSAVCEAMRARGILVRDRGKEIAGAVRFTVGTREQTAAAVAALEEVLTRWT